MTLGCKWITDEAGPLVRRTGQFSYSWSICRSGVECPGAPSGHMKWPETTAVALVESRRPERCS